MRKNICGMAVDNFLSRQQMEKSVEVLKTRLADVRLVSSGNAVLVLFFSLMIQIIVITTLAIKFILIIFFISTVHQLTV